MTQDENGDIFGRGGGGGAVELRAQKRGIVNCCYKGE